MADSVGTGDPSLHGVGHAGEGAMEEGREAPRPKDRKEGLMPKIEGDNAAGACAGTGYKTVVVLVLSLAILVFFLAVDLDTARPEASKGAAVLAITALWWISEVVPLTITSLLPMALYPLLGVSKASTLAGKFFVGTSFLFIAGFFIGLAVERWGLHHRIVCAVVSRAGRRVELVIMGFMTSVWLLSMWISNTACILSMLPVAQAFLATLPEGCERFESGFLLAIGYSATVGGIATPVGTPTNGIFMEMFSSFWPSEGEFSFATFFLCAFPLSALLLVVVWVGVCVIYVWGSPKAIPVDHEVFRRMRIALGQVSFEQIVVSVDLVVLIVLWFTASPIGNFRGWKASVAKELDSGTIGLALTLPLFLVPCGARLPAPLRRIIGEDRCLSRVALGPPPRHILDWDAVKGGFKWEILFVFGGGALIAHGSVASGLAAWAAERLADLGTGEVSFVFMVAVVVCYVTEVVSNMATLSIFGSIVTATAQANGYDPVQMLLVVTFAASFAFMLPMAGGGNMVVYSTGKVGLRFMAWNGLALNLLAILFGGMYLAFVMPTIMGSYKYLPPLSVV
mmetsp:Transcript_101841/g.227494  ORF Transcript_101841/g.227494 Transcript_101841/m.227494 type:complete len:566 (-) Transcript_101841:240-1937(-)